jgi:hypothetical protein
MTASSPPPHAQPPTVSSLVDVLTAVEEIEDVGALTGAHAPEWLQRLDIPKGWRLIGLADNPQVPLARLVLRGPLDDGSWEGTETISVFGYTGWPTFYGVLSNAAGTLRCLGATNIVTKVLPIPPTRWTAALRSSGAALIGDRRVWMQQSNYVAGSDKPHAGRLLVHSIFVDARCRARLAKDITQMSDAVHQGFVATLSNEHRTC